MIGGDPVGVKGRVRTIFDGRYRYRGPVYTVDPEHYRCVGLFPERVKFVGVKSQERSRRRTTPSARALSFTPEAVVL